MAVLALDASIARQAEMLVAQATLAQQRGYMMLPFGLSTSAVPTDSFLYNYLSYALAEYARARARLRGHRVRGPVVVSLHFGAADYQVSMTTSKLAIGTGTTFCFRVPDLARYRPINVALELMSTKTKRDGHTRGSGFLRARQVAGDIEYAGTGREALRAVLATFHNPNHRDILRAG